MSITNILRRAVATAAFTRGCPVTLVRGGAETADVTAVPGRTPFEIDDGDGLVVTVESRDWLIDSTYYRLNDAVTLPEPGDLIREIDGSTLYTYEVLPFGSEPCYRFADQHRAVLRIHSKLKTTEAV